jgi:hypothetical protein
MVVLRRLVRRSRGLGLDHIGLSLFRVVDEQNFSRRRAGIHAVMPGSERLDEDRSGWEFPPGSVLHLDRERAFDHIDIANIWMLVPSDIGTWRDLHHRGGDLRIFSRIF